MSVGIKLSNYSKTIRNRKLIVLFLYCLIIAAISCIQWLLLEETFAREIKLVAYLYIPLMIAIKYGGLTEQGSHIFLIANILIYSIIVFIFIYKKKLKSSFKLYYLPCPYCDKSVRTYEDWQCRFCDKHQGKVRYITSKCTHCKRKPETTYCEHCHEEISL